VAIKVAATLDGKVATANRESKWITGEPARKFAHTLRNTYDAVLVGIGTIIADDPRLTTRLPEKTGRDPIRIILDSQCRISPKAAVLTQKSAAPTIIAVTETASKERIEAVKKAGGSIFILPADELGGVSLKHLLQTLAERDITSIMVEGGPTVSFSFISQKLADKIYYVIAPKILGGSDAVGSIGGPGFEKLAQAVPLKNLNIFKIGDDICLEGYFPSD
jgi:diaminohydroxyphosphoribosylaminopyrimidine deaminase / 5-amino-6-(5-phosphoribosylamino)uracil reductase